MLSQQSITAASHQVCNLFVLWSSTHSLKTVFRRTFTDVGMLESYKDGEDVRLQKHV